MAMRINAKQIERARPEGAKSYTLFWWHTAWSCVCHLVYRKNLIHSFL